MIVCLLYPNPSSLIFFSFSSKSLLPKEGIDSLTRLHRVRSLRSPNFPMFRLRFSSTSGTRAQSVGPLPFIPVEEVLSGPLERLRTSEDVSFLTVAYLHSRPKSDRTLGPFLQIKSGNVGLPRPLESRR